MTKFKVTPDNVEDKWSWVVKLANRRCYDSNKHANIVGGPHLEDHNSEESAA